MILAPDLHVVTPWRKSTRSNGGNDCVEVAPLAVPVTAYRDSKNPTGAALLFSRAEWTSFVRTIRAGLLDLS
ncbi:protein of unknown function (DUF397) [Streptoalloteichus tenebrarius]|uniref:DUF397 domain-containing protein n=1 Tax=Streptoalloteichus tenebrarius (strain ATCC 17920 / DSM 40477 / JCM 4838 / CBS 697.72 / NBRC 16177 / NCIMB 11028 / NRRL B-12390 / A12253. 1 / ISP 5477) TaxID=1933 RepID=A0ABT1HV70_STRSD|nr:DUF397 domain-containing protein [Streptoalloteichus tenebrarius]MCP2259429.1 protein of unknown function (DUF397) [Streptoalloteichus tenebrarius]BFF02372.1 hypothetical protein GCM10020241_40470 [Streptoalloteichus tenebrarius]